MVRQSGVKYSSAVVVFAAGLALAGCTGSPSPQPTLTLGPGPVGTASVVVDGKELAFTVTDCIQSGAILQVSGISSDDNSATVSAIVDVEAALPTLFVYVGSPGDASTGTQYIASDGGSETPLSFVRDGLKMSGSGTFIAHEVVASGGSEVEDRLVPGKYDIECGSVAEAPPRAPDAVVEEAPAESGVPLPEESSAPEEEPAPEDAVEEPSGG
jgi:hypothetical protein